MNQYLNLLVCSSASFVSSIMRAQLRKYPSDSTVKFLTASENLDEMKVK